MLKTGIYFALSTSMILTATITAAPYDATDEECVECPEMCAPLKNDRNNLAIGPEVYYLERTRSGGTTQHGTLIGVRANYDYIKRYCFYFGAQAFYGTGTLTGHTGSDKKLRSHWTDEMVEGYIGYTFQQKEDIHLSFTPMIGYGYMREINKYLHPSPLHLKFITSFEYVAYGFLSSAQVLPSLKIGLNARFRSPIDPRCKVSNDPDHQNIKQIIGDEVQYRIETPFVYESKCLWEGFRFSFMPFYETRLYGERANYPFDFPKTNIDIYGINIQLIYHF